MKKESFEYYLKVVHMIGYHGTDDDAPEAFDSWLENLDVEEWLKLAAQWEAVINF